MKSHFPLLALTMLLTLLTCSPRLVAQSDDDNGVSLGDIARALRRDKEKAKEQGQKEPPSAQTVIDNDNLSQVVKQAENDRLKTSMNFVFDGIGKDIRVSAPDVTCNLTFSAKTGVLVSDPFVPQELPRNELGMLDGPAVINGDALQVTVHNGTAWNLREITVGLTILRQASPSAAANFGSARLIPAAAADEESSGNVLILLCSTTSKVRPRPSRPQFFTRTLVQNLNQIKSGTGLLCKRRASRQNKLRYSVRPTSSASSRHFQRQSTSVKPISFSHLSCVSTSSNLLEGSSFSGAMAKHRRNSSCNRAVGDDTCSRLQNTPFELSTWQISE